MSGVGWAETIDHYSLGDPPLRRVSVSIPDQVGYPNHSCLPKSKEGRGGQLGASPSGKDLDGQIVELTGLCNRAAWLNLTFEDEVSGGTYLVFVIHMQKKPRLPRLLKFPALGTLRPPATKPERESRRKEFNNVRVGKPSPTPHISVSKGVHIFVQILIGLEKKN